MELEPYMTVPPRPADKPLPEALLCRVFNPTKRPRVIYDGILNAKPLRIMPGETRELVLSKATVLRLRRDENCDVEEGPDLRADVIGPGTVVMYERVADVSDEELLATSGSLELSAPPPPPAEANSPPAAARRLRPAPAS
jgi:hypothetical protein